MSSSFSSQAMPDEPDLEPDRGLPYKWAHMVSNPSERIDRLIAGLTDWRGKTFAGIRKCILEADREIIEEWKWMGSPVWSRDGMIAVANAHKGKVKLTFAYGEPSGS